MKKYYEAYEDRYKTAHEKGVSWSSSQCTPIVLEKGYRLLATDISPEAVDYRETGDGSLSPFRDCVALTLTKDPEPNQNSAAPLRNGVFLRFALSVLLERAHHVRHLLRGFDTAFFKPQQEHVIDPAGDKRGLVVGVSAFIVGQHDPVKLFLHKMDQPGPVNHLQPFLVSDWDDMNAAAMKPCHAEKNAWYLSSLTVDADQDQQRLKDVI